MKSPFTRADRPAGLLEHAGDDGRAVPPVRQRKEGRELGRVGGLARDGPAHGRDEPRVGPAAARSGRTRASSGRPPPAPSGRPGPGPGAPSAWFTIDAVGGLADQRLAEVGERGQGEFAARLDRQHDRDPRHPRVQPALPGGQAAAVDRPVQEVEVDLVQEPLVGVAAATCDRGRRARREVAVTRVAGGDRVVARPRGPEGERGQVARQGGRARPRSSRRRTTTEPVGDWMPAGVGVTNAVSTTGWPVSDRVRRRGRARRRSRPWSTVNVIAAEVDGGVIGVARVRRRDRVGAGRERRRRETSPRPGRSTCRCRSRSCRCRR